jgi:hypothetical protein
MLSGILKLSTTRCETLAGKSGSGPKGILGHPEHVCVVIDLNLGERRHVEKFHIPRPFL